MSASAQEDFDGLFDTNNAEPEIHSEDLSRSPDRSDSSSDHDGSTTLHSSGELSTAPSLATAAMPSTSYLSNTTQFDANTGPKGVIADARSFETARKRSFRQTIYAFTDNTPFKRLNVANREKSKTPSPDSSADEDEDEDDFMRTWRQKRFDELASMKQEIKTRRQSPSKRRYGSLIAVDPAGYLDAVEKVGAETVVVVLIYDEEYDMSNRVEDVLDLLARKHVTTRFVKLHYQDAEMSEIAAPGVLAYRAGECFANLVSLVNEIPAGKDVTIPTVENVLQRYNILT